MRSYFTEALGTFLLVFVGTFIATKSGGSVLIISFGFGVTLTVIIMLFGAVSGAHVNPAVSLGAWIAGKLSIHDLAPYWIAQFAGAIAGSMLLRMILGSGESLVETTFAGSAQNALIIEAVLTFLFVMVILNVAHKKQAAFIIGAMLFLIHLVGIDFTGASVNPARSVAPVVVGANAIAAGQIWVYVVGPLIGGLAAGLLAKCMKK